MPLAISVANLIIGLMLRPLLALFAILESDTWAWRMTLIKATETFNVRQGNAPSLDLGQHPVTSYEVV